MFSILILTFNIAQFLPSLNHCLLPLILRKARFNPKVDCFFSNYLVRRKTQCFWNNFSSLFFNVDIKVEQGSALSPILSMLYLASIFHILEKHLKILKMLVSILSFVDNGLLVVQSKLLIILNSFLFCSYNIASFFLEKFSLIMELGKTEVFYFSRLHRVFGPPPLNLSTLGGPILCPRDTWKYLGFIFNRKLFLYQYINYYVDKAIPIIQCMKILRNSVHGLIPY